MEKKVADFFDLLHDRAIRPIESSDIKESCTASLLLMFAVIDSLSKITCTSEEYVQFMKGTGNKVRFKNFLGNVMGDHYGYYKDQLYNLRNDIVHTAINTKVILSKDLNGYHLEAVSYTHLTL